MFFYIGDHCPLTALKQVEPRLFLDDGWNQKSGIWYKGYSTECVLEDSIYDIVNGYQPAGKWCVICADEIYHPELRGFPVYRKNDDLTNIQFDGYDIEIYPDPVYEPYENISMEYASELIGDILLENTRNFYKYNDVGHVTLIASAGLDTTTCWAILDKVTYDYTIFAPVTVETPKSLIEYTGAIREYDSDLIDKVGNDYWGYAIPSYLKHKNWVVSGYYAETIQYRDAEAISAIANYQGKWIDEIVEETDYLYWFLKRPTVDGYKKQKLTFASEAALKDFLFRTTFYDCQMWHLDNNMFFNPFFDKRIPNIMSGLSIQDLTKNAANGDIQRNIIKRFKPELLDTLSDYKNAGDTWKNFKETFVNVKLDPRTKLNIRNFSSIRQKSS